MWLNIDEINYERAYIVVKKQLKKQVKQAKVDIHPVYAILLIIAVTAAATTALNYIIWQMI